MNQIRVRPPRILLKSQRSQIKSALLTRTWAPQRQGFDSGRRQFHASAPRRSVLPEAVELWQAIHPIWLGLPAVAIAPHLLRLGWELHQLRGFDRRLEKVEPLINICSSIVAKRKRKLSTRAVSTKVDMDRMLRLKELEVDVIDRLAGRVLSPQNFLPPVLHLWWTVLAVGALSPQGPLSAAVAEAPGMSTALTVIGDHPVVGFVFLCLGWFNCLRTNPFRVPLTENDVEKMSPVWRLLTGFEWNCHDPPKGPFVVPTWLYYLRLDRWKASESFRNMNTTNRPLGQQRNTEPDISTDYGVGQVLSFSLLTWAISQLSPLQTLYLLGSLTGQAIRRGILYIEREKREKRKIKRQKKWMPLAPDYSG